MGEIHKETKLVLVVKDGLGIAEWNLDELEDTFELWSTENEFLREVRIEIAQHYDIHGTPEEIAAFKEMLEKEKLRKEGWES